MDGPVYDMDPLELNNYLSSRSYVNGFSYSYADLTLYKKISQCAEKYEKCFHVQRWLRHVKLLSSQAGNSIKEVLHEDKKLPKLSITKGNDIL